MPNSGSPVCSSRTQSGLSTHSTTWPRWLVRRTRSSDGVTLISSHARAVRLLIRNAHQIASTSRPKKPSTGQAPIIKNIMPAMKLMTQTKHISTRKPVRLSERCGVSSAENNSGCGTSRSNALLPSVMACQYTPIMAKITRKAKKTKPAKKAVKSKLAKKAPKPKPWTEAEVYEAFSRFRKANPEPRGELEHLNPYTLLVAVVLSAQATDAGVNKATRVLFEVADSPQKMLDLGEEKLRDYIRTIGLYRTKARNVIALSDKLIREFGGEVPRTRAEIESLPGAGRKTANVVLNMAYGEHTMAVDTHVFRVGNRTGLAPGKTPLEVELGLEKVIPSEFMLHAHHWLILHGRYTCLARGPRCEVCLINDLCRWPEKTV
jgi:endonuclease-3